MWFMEGGMEMQRTDRFLIGIVVGAVVIIVLAVVVVLLKPEATYLPDDTPDGVSHNYLLALQNKDFSKAYGYLSTRIEGYPATLEDFENQVLRNSWQFNIGEGVTLKVDSADIRSNRATVHVIQTRFHGGGLFDTGQSMRAFEMSLSNESGGWKITDSDNYFAYCWRYDNGCQ
jgi:hypothetical protein